MLGRWDEGWGKNFYEAHLINFASTTDNGISLLEIFLSIRLSVLCLEKNNYMTSFSTYVFIHFTKLHIVEQ